MARYMKLPIRGEEGKLVYGDDIIDNIVLLAVEEISGVELYSSNPKKKSNAIKVTKLKDGVHVDVVVKIYYAQSVSETAFKIQESIRHNVEAMTECHIASVNVSIKGVSFDDKTEESNVALTNVKQDGHV
ncbi:MAG: Asp23/Gls24 family envelope stress response protein [Clostridiales bacterium]|nr:Asp23/Gls24 family envelope stress response protein [Clostridiales bacterium]